ncbi:cyclic nucleotide-binding domain-containing protein [Chitinivibrio alkaliphilus]|uniref:CAP family of transcription factor n=1 Tax=Chitinivibrio alkaliphilus ACht1 TaxID=1313304 RepID=U7DC51_9BACT|nr:cyclic nucleotide-binding domain-containing protein [Chitinivibrio alkaliphilus]ERP31995.1 CAP family of transcription factor [Chitinivibrio alkaliphilus ACht1]
MGNRGFEYIANMVVLRNCPLFSSLSPGELRRLTGAVRQFRCEAHDVLLKEGDSNTTLYLLSSGEVELTSAEGVQRRISAQEKGTTCFFGEIDLFLPGNRVDYTVIALAPTEILTLGRTDLYALMSENPSIPIRIVEMFSTRLAEYERRRRDTVL